MPDGDPDLDARFSLANERTFLAWVRTSLALLAGGVAAAKAIDFQHEVWRWVVAAPPMLAGGALAVDAAVRWRRYEDAMRRGARLPAGRGVWLVAIGIGLYAVLALTATVLDS